MIIDQGTGKRYVPPTPKKKIIKPKPKKKVTYTIPSGGGNTTTTPTKTTNTTTKTTTTATDTSSLDKLWAQAAGYKAQIDVLTKQGFKYDPNTDPSYKSLQTMAQKNAKVAKGEAMETLNDRGILNSTVTSDRLGQIEQSSQDAVTAQIPALQNSAYGRYMDKINQLNNLWTATVQQANNERNYNLERDKYNTAVDQWDQEFNYNKGQDAIKNQQEDDRIQLAYYDYDLREAGLAQDQVGYKDEKSTQSALAELLTFKTAADALNHLRTNAAKYINSGASITDIIAGLEKVWPGFEDKAGTTSTGNIFNSKK